jgi:hypothetical protein
VIYVTVACVQYDDNVVGPGSPKYDDAYFEINYVRAYTTGGPAPTQSASSVSVGTNGSRTAVRLPAPTGHFSGPTNSDNTPPDVMGRGGDMTSFEFLPLMGLHCLESL